MQQASLEESEHPQELHQQVIPAPVLQELPIQVPHAPQERPPKRAVELTMATPRQASRPLRPRKLLMRFKED